MATEERAYKAYLEWIEQARRVIAIFEQDGIKLPKHLKQLKQS